ncbi:ParA family partition ATPase (plasmid) [Pseudomonas aeruginosa]|nr:ParA family partition ATPase [Pseudomonas aeruginosa]
MTAKIVAFLNQKGGSGKTTISTNVATALRGDGLNVILADTDPQGSARDWRDAGNGEDTVPVIGLDRPALIEKDLRSLARNADLIILDGAPQVQQLAAAAVRTADLILIPVQPSPYDIWAASDTVELIKTRQELSGGQPKAAFIISRAIKNTILSKEVKDALASYDLPVFEAGTSNLVAYTTAATEGKSVIGYGDKNAEREITAIVEELKTWLA